MQVRVMYHVNVTDDFRRSIRRYYGQSGLATRNEVKDWFYLFGQSMNEDMPPLTPHKHEHPAGAQGYTHEHESGGSHVHDDGFTYRGVVVDNEGVR